MSKNAEQLKPIVVSVVASQHLDDVYTWYERKQSGLGKRFLSGVETTFQKIQRTPEGYPIIDEPHRRLLMTKFPYWIFYEEQETKIIISAVFHTSRNPDDWQNLL